MTTVAELDQAIGERYERLPIELLLESPLNPRKTFDPVKLKELAASIAQKGVVEPLVVREHAKKRDTFEIICGARRYRASKLAEQHHVPAVIRALTDAQVIELMAIENSQRDDVPPLEEAAGYKQLLLIDKTYTAAMIAEKIGRTEKFVWDRLRLLELIDPAKELLTAGVIGVEHAEVIAKLKPAEQKRVMSRENGGLFEGDYALAFDEDQRPGATAFSKVKPRSVRQLKEWIARNVRFDVQHAAVAAPLEFGETARKVEEAEALGGRGKRVVPITFQYMCPYGAAADERTYGASAWKKAVGKDGEPTCDFAVLGVVVAGEHYGESFHVCIARDRCVTHWKESVQAKAKAAKLRESGQTKKAAKVEKKAAESYEQKQRREEAARKQRSSAWEAIERHVFDEAVAQVKKQKAITPKQAALLLEDDYGLEAQTITHYLGTHWFKTPGTALLVNAVATFNYTGWNSTKSGFDEYIAEIVKPYGLDEKRFLAIRDEHQPKDAAAPAKSTKKGKAA